MRRRAKVLAEEERAPDICPGAPRTAGGHCVRCGSQGQAAEGARVPSWGGGGEGGSGEARSPLPGPLRGRGLLAHRVVAVSRALGGSSQVGERDSWGQNAPFGG